MAAPKAPAKAASTKGRGKTAPAQDTAPANPNGKRFDDATLARAARKRAIHRTVQAYLDALESRGQGRRVSPEKLQSKLAVLTEQLEGPVSSVDRIKLLQTRLDVEKQLATLETTVDFDELERQAVEVLKEWADNGGITYAAFRQFGVSPEVLREAGIPRTRLSAPA